MSSHRKFQENWEYISVEDWGGKYGKDPVSINRRFDNIWLFIKNDQEFCIKVLLKQRNDVCHVRCGLIMKRVEKWKKVINQVTARPHYEKSAIPNHFWQWIIVDKIQVDIVTLHLTLLVLMTWFWAHNTKRKQDLYLKDASSSTRKAFFQKLTKFQLIFSLIVFFVQK